MERSARAAPGRLLLCLHIINLPTMSTNNTQATLLQCAVCPVRLSCPWSQFSNAIRQKYCPMLLQPAPKVIETAGAHEEERYRLTRFLQERLN